MGDKVYWAELQSRLSHAGLNISVNIPTRNSPWFGEIDGKVFAMTVSGIDEKDDKRHFLLLSLSGQNEETVIPIINGFMGYSPFCKYSDRRSDQTFIVNYEWDKDDPKSRLEEIVSNANTYNLVKL